MTKCYQCAHADFKTPIGKQMGGFCHCNPRSVSSIRWINSFRIGSGYDGAGSNGAKFLHWPVIGIFN